MKKVNSLTLDLITRFYKIYVEEVYDGSFSDFELIILIRLVLDLRDIRDMEDVLC